MSLYKWSKTAATNATADSSVNWAEGMAPSAVNDSSRAEMAAVAKWRDDISGTLTTAGTATAYTLTTNQVFSTAALMSGAQITFIPNADSGAAPTLAVDGLTACALNVSTGVAVPTGYFKTGTPYTVTYIHATTEFIVHNASSVLPSGVSMIAGQYTSPVGTVAAPTYTFVGDLDCGMYRIGANNLGVAVNGAKVLDIATTGLTVTGALSSTTSLTAGNGFTVTTGTVTLPAASIAAAALVATANAFGAGLYHLQEQRASGVASSNAPTSGAWRTVVLTTEVAAEITSATLSSNVISLPAGTYRINAKYAAANTEKMQLRFYDTTSSALLATGIVQQVDQNGGPGRVPLSLDGTFVLGGTKNCELQIQVGTTATAAAAGGFGTEVYVDLLLWKVA